VALGPLGGVGQLEVGRALHVLVVGAGRQRVALGDELGQGLGPEEAREDRHAAVAQLGGVASERGRAGAVGIVDRVPIEVDEGSGVRHGR